MKFIYYLMCIGNPDLEKKLYILHKNLTYIHNNIRQKFSIVVNCYNNKELIEKFLNKSRYPFLDNIYIYHKKGILTEVWLTNPYNNILHQYDYILLMLDDVLIKNINISRMIDIKNKYKIQILSPRVIGATYKYMYSYNHLTINNSVELFCFLLTAKDFELFSSMHTIENKWMWGSDLLYGYFGIKAGIYHKDVVIHCLSSKSDKKTASELGIKYLQKFGFKSFSDIRNVYWDVIKEIRAPDNR